MLEKELVIILHMLEESLWNIYADKKKNKYFSRSGVIAKLFVLFFFLAWLSVGRIPCLSQSFSFLLPLSQGCYQSAAFRTRRHPAARHAREVTGMSNTTRDSFSGQVLELWK